MGYVLRSDCQLYAPRVLRAGREPSARSIVLHSRRHVVRRAAVGTHRCHHMVREEFIGALIDGTRTRTSRGVLTPATHVTVRHTRGRAETTDNYVS